MYWSTLWEPIQASSGDHEFSSKTRYEQRLSPRSFHVQSELDIGNEYIYIYKYVHIHIDIQLHAHVYVYVHIHILVCMQTDNEVLVVVAVSVRFRFTFGRLAAVPSDDVPSYFAAASSEKV